METIKIKLFLFCAALWSAALLNAQTAVNKCVSQGNFVIDAYYGYPYVVGKILKNLSNGDDNGVEISSARNTNHIGGKFEYMINDHFGIGADYTFARVTNYINTLDYRNEIGQYKVANGSYKESLTKQRVLVRMNIHFGTTSTIDPYISFGAGYKQSVYKNDFPSDYPINDVNINLIPISFRAAIGMRWFFMDGIGLNFEGGIGGPAIQGGVSVKF
ncbi:MAG: outer membrane beta-barrel protein [Bacteroidia bacterium]